jgi:hypothetical protein
VIVAEVHVAAALLAHGGLRRCRDVQFRAASKTGDVANIALRRRNSRSGLELVLNAIVLAALLANRGIGGGWF